MESASTMNNNMDNILSPTHSSVTSHSKGKASLSLGRAEQLNQTLFKISNAVRSSKDLEELYGSIHRILGEIIDLTNFFIALYHNEEKRISFPYFRDIYDAEDVYCDKVEIENSLTGGVIQNATPVFLRKNELEKRRDSKTLVGTVPELWLGVPLKIKDEVIGVMVTLSYHDAELFDEMDLNTLISVSDQIALAIERKQYEQALISSEKKYRTILETMVEGYFEQDQNSIITLANPAMCRILDKPVEKVVGTNFKVLLENLETNTINDKFQDIFNSQKTTLNIEFELILSNDSIRYLEGTFSSILDDNNAITGKKGIVRDITEKKKAEQTQKKLEEKLQQSQKLESIGTLAGGIAHEFNNMLAIIMGNNELIMDELPQGSFAKESTEEIRIAGRRAREVVKQLLTFSRQDNAVKKVMDFNFVVQESMKLICSSTPANIKIEQNISPDTYSVVGNATQISQILINLCNNAVDALPEKGGRISIELLNETIDKNQTKPQVKLPPGQYAKLMVSDNGIGMDGEILGRVFEPYFTTKDIGEGTGIGMAVVHGIVERHGGAIIVDSKPGQGTAFTIFLPAHEVLLEQKTDAQDILPVGDEHILYVDDEPSIAILGRRLLESLGYTTESTTKPEKALDMVRSDPNRFDLLITDMAMPNMTGDQLVIETLKIRQDMPTIICTGYSAKLSEEEATQIGVRSYLMKPINRSELAKIVRKVLDGAKSS
ncbi:MAG: two-component system cell cycle sensor histidine kinase/response regulator CckA [Desulforhopalus sp.]|jgi:two-component system cell cycle sensor histidine kinase/response regulator CckA